VLNLKIVRAVVNMQEIKCESVISTSLIPVGDLVFEVDSCGAGNRLVLCLHGFPESSFSWRHQLPLLASMGYKAWAPNLRGYGCSSKPLKVSDYAVDKLLEDVEGLIAVSGCDEVTLVAHDWGGALAWVYASRHVKSLKKLVVMNCPHPIAFKSDMNLRQYFMSWYMCFFQLPYLPEWFLGRNKAMPIRRMFEKTSVNKDKFPPEVTEVYRRNATRPGALSAMINYYRALFRFPPRLNALGSEHANISVPTLLIWGEKDLALSKHLAISTEKYVNGLQTEFISGGSHWIQQDCPTQVNQLLSKFLQDN
jgi:epoxide hydrolase 4